MTKALLSGRELRNREKLPSINMVALDMLIDALFSLTHPEQANLHTRIPTDLALFLASTHG